MRVADYIFQTLCRYGVKHVFLVSGGGAMHLNDALGRCPGITYICNQHEQACAMAAEGYARISGLPGVINVTTGPGGTNAITGVMGAWVDSIPMLILSGQVKRATTIAGVPHLGLRQLGDQEINIIDLVRPITKYAASIERPEDIRCELEKAWWLCRNGRPGPVWLDIPLDIQAAELPEPEKLTGYEPVRPEPPAPSREALRETAALLSRAKRPVIVAGNGVRLAGAVDALRHLAECGHLPVLTAISGIDLLESDHPYFFGRPGILGERAANFILQNADLVLVLGCRMGIRQIGYAYETVAREACKIMVDIDEAELRKPTFRPDRPIHADAGCFLAGLQTELPQLPPASEWLDYCRRMRQQYPVILPSHRQRTDYVSSYVLPELLSNSCRDDAIIVTGNGTAYTSTFQALPVKRGMRVFANEGCAAMGYDLPAAIGAALAGGGRPVICVTGDGSIQMNLQELQTVINYALPLKILVYNNAGYLSIKLTQRAFFGGNYVGAESGSGVRLPELSKLAAAYGIDYARLTNNAEAADQLPELLARPGAVLIEVMTDPFEELGPKAASKRLPDGRMVSAPLEDLAPFLPREEFRRNMFIAPLDEIF